MVLFYQVQRRGKKEMPNSAYREEKRHGPVHFPFTIYPCTIPGDFPQVNLHWQTGMEIVYIKKGRGIVQAAPGREGMHPAAQGDIFLFPPGMLHGLRQEPGEVMEYENIIFDVALLGGAGDLCDERYLLPLQAGRLALPLCVRPGQAFYEAAASCLQRTETANKNRSAGYELAIKAALLEFLAILVGVQDAPPPSIDTMDTRRLKQVLQFVQERYTGPVTVGEAAACCGCSPSHFMRWFKRMTGQSFVGYLNEYRLTSAAERLRHTDDTVLSIAGQTGFENLSHFNRQFKKRYGISPREYRKA